VRTGQRGWLSWVSLGAAYLLMLQTLVVGFRLGGEADQVDTIICSPAGDQAAPNMPGQGHRHGPDCCLIGCGLCGSSAATPTEIRPINAVVLKELSYDRIIAKSESTSHRARGPPQAV
jgi:hypothetical protein